jgi:hypothetical protein
VTARHAAGLLLLLVLACRPSPSPAGGARHPAMTVEQVLARHTGRLMAIPGVVGVARGEVNGRPAIQILVVKTTPELRRRLPTTLDGFPVQVVESGTIKAQPFSAPPAP